MKTESEYIKRIMNRANAQKMVGYLIYGADVAPEDSNCYEARLNEAYKKLDNIADGDEKLLTAINEIIAIFSDLYAEIGFKAGIIFTADVFREKGELS